MNPEKLVLMVSEDCNFRCRYCYHIRESKTMSPETALKALDLFLPRMPDPANIYFLGGEPLINLDTIKETVAATEARNRKTGRTCRYHISTNGSLIDEEALEFFHHHRVTVELSFDGLAQDLGRQNGSFQQLIPILGRLKNSPGITLMVNSVFYPPTVPYLSESIRFLLDLDLPHLSLGLALDFPWDDQAIDVFEGEFRRLMASLLGHVARTGRQPLHFFPDLESKGIWGCTAGQNQITVTGTGEIWGCALFYEYYKNKKKREWKRDYCFGTLDEFSGNHNKKTTKITENHKELSQDHFSTENARCFLCPEIEKCGVCPVFSAFFHGNPKQVPGHICRINRIAIREKKEFQNRLNDIQ